MQSESVYEKMTNAEKEVAEVLKDFGIKWSYERPVFIWMKVTGQECGHPISIYVHLEFILKFVDLKNLTTIIGEEFLIEMDIE